MAAPDLGAIRAAIAKQLGDIAGVQAQPYLLGNPTPPTLWVFPGGAGETAVEYHQAMRNGLETWQFTVQAFVGLTTDIGAQKRLDELLASSGAHSVKAVLEEDETLGGLVDDLTVTSATGYRVFTLQAAQGPVLGCEWFVEVMAPGQ